MRNVYATTCKEDGFCPNVTTLRSGIYFRKSVCLSSVVSL